jgi:hypothetical protein
VDTSVSSNPGSPELYLSKVEGISSKSNLPSHGKYSLIIQPLATLGNSGLGVEYFRDMEYNKC